MVFDDPQSRNEAILQNLLGADNVLVEPESRIEAILQSILNETAYLDEPQSRMEELLLAVKDDETGWDAEALSRNEAIIIAWLNDEEYTEEPQSRIEELLIAWLASIPKYVLKTVVGKVLSITDAIEAPAEGLVVELLPKQDLHGYDSPWPAGGGDQKYNFANWEWTQSRRYFGSDSSSFRTALNALPAGTYTIVAKIKVDTVDEEEGNRTYGFLCTGVSINGQVTKEKQTVGTIVTIAKTFTLSSNQVGLFTHCYWYAGTGTTTTEYSTFYDVGINVGSETTYIPYSNLCPITGTESCEVVRTGINLWDEEWETGGLDGHGQNTIANNRIRSKNYISVAPETTYFAKSTGGLFIRCYDAEKNHLGIVNNGTRVTNSTFNLLDGTRYIRFITADTEYGGTYKNDISINYPATDTAYHAFDPQSTTLDVEWGAVGKNLLNCEVVAYSTTRANIVNKDDGTTLFPLKAGTYTFSNNGSNAYAYWRKEGTTDNNIIHTSGGTNYGTFTLTEDANYMFWLYVNGIDASEYTEIQLEKGSTKTPYEPYTKTIYGGHVDAVSGVIELTHKMVGLNDIAWSKDSTYNYYITTSLLSDAIDANASSQNFMSSGYVYNAITNTNTVLGGCLIWKRLRIRESDMSLSADDWKALRASENIQFVYRLAQPITLPIDPHTLTALAKNTVWSDANGDITLTYRAKAGD